MLLNLKLVVFTLTWWWAWYHHHHGAIFVVADPETIPLNQGCSPYNATNPRVFLATINGVLSELREEIITQRNKHFGTAQRAMGGETNLYAMFQCRNYLSQNDCLACFDNATTQIRNCSDASGARVHYEGCFLRYETNIFFFGETTIPGNDGVICGNKNSNESMDTNALDSVTKQALMDLRIATPQIKGFSAATKTQVVGGGGGWIYAFAQCVETATNSSCSDCITVGSINLQSCFPNADGTTFDAGCFVRYSRTPFFADYQTIDITLQSKQGGSSKKWGIVGGVAAGGVALVMIFLALFVWHVRSKQLKRINGGDISGATELKGPINYKYNDLKAATKNFSEENKIGHGGFGNVYKGSLKNGKYIAVKKLILNKSNKMEDNFQSEVKLISNVHHINLVRLLGCCSKGPERILVYEYIANRSLDRFLFGNRKGSLNWKQRYDIILGIARGLAYLHEEFHVSIIHRDIKTGNILLDDELHPKIADFGLARLLPGDQSHLSTNFAGTLGYTPPEYAMHGQLSEKVDIYSYGIVVLEIISGQKSTEMKVDDNDHEYLLQRAWKLHEQGKHIDLMEKSLDPNEYDAEEVKKITGIALLCTQASASMRPTMSEVIILLKGKGVLEHMVQPTMPIFVESNFRSRVIDIPVLTTGSSTSASNNNAIVLSNATYSTSTVSAR